MSIACIPAIYRAETFKRYYNIFIDFEVLLLARIPERRIDELTEFIQ
jgi:hypothetical protein